MPTNMSGGMRMMRRQERPDDCQLAAGETHRMLRFIGKAFRGLGYDLERRGMGVARPSSSKGFTNA